MIKRKAKRNDWNYWRVPEEESLVPRLWWSLSRSYLFWGCDNDGCYGDDDDDAAAAFNDDYDSVVHFNHKNIISAIQST